MNSTRDWRSGKPSTARLLRLSPAPLLLIRGEKDMMIADEFAQDTKNRLINSKLVAVKGYGHHILSNDPEGILGIIKENYSFLLQK